MILSQKKKKKKSCLNDYHLVSRLCRGCRGSLTETWWATWSRSRMRWASLSFFTMVVINMIKITTIVRWARPSLVSLPSSFAIMSLSSGSCPLSPLFRWLLKLSNCFKGILETPSHLGFVVVKLLIFSFPDPCLASTARVSQVAVEQGKGGRGKGSDDQVLCRTQVPRYFQRLQTFRLRS